MEEIKLPTYGGQAVIEGVMMRGKRAVAIAMRAPDKSIVIHQEQLSGIYKSRLAKIPFLRGLIMLWDALGLGIRALTISANTQTGENEKIEGPALFATLLLALAFSAGLFFITPAAVGHLAESLLAPATPLAATTDDSGSSLQAAETPATASSPTSAAHLGRAAWLGNLVEGLIRLMILIAYIWLVGRIPDIQRVFAYHGAEHKTINAFEAGVELTPENVSRFSLEHPRCGTAFLLTLVLISILVFALLGPLPVAWRFASRIVFIPILAGLAYEYIRWTASHLNSPVVKLMIRPNLALQRLTTREPSREMLEVSIAAFNTMRNGESEISL
jgi:uncharacterized protein YqhQ